MRDKDVTRSVSPAFAVAVVAEKAKSSFVAVWICHDEVERIASLPFS